MNELKVFKNSEFGELKIMVIDGKEYFPATECAKMLGYSNPHDAIKRHCKGVVKREGVYSTTNQHGVTTEQAVEANYIPEGDLYRLIIKSNLPSAEKFERWVFDEVLPSIRKTGGYIAGEEQMTDDELMAKALEVAQRKLTEREARIAQLTKDNQKMLPKAEYFDDLVERNLLTSFRTTAKEFRIGERVFINFLKEKGFLYRDKSGKLMPYAQNNDGLFEVKECTNDKTGWAGTQTLVTPKGRETFRLLTQRLREEEAS